jgi:divalent metal cation (Fe/Co/Zn/Cd) transporter
VTAEAASPKALREGIALEIASIAWMVLEAALAIVAGVAARSVLLIGFGLDSVIELLSAGLLVWRLTGGGIDDVERVVRRERLAARLAAVLLLLLAVYLVVSSAVGLVARFEPENSWLGLLVAGLAVVIMPLLGWRKRVAASKLHSAALRADAIESLACAYLALATLVGVGASTLLGWWWAEYVAALVLAVLILREAREAFAETREAGQGEETTT